MITQSFGKSRSFPKNRPNFLETFCEHSPKKQALRRQSEGLWKTLWEKWKTPVESVKQADGFSVCPAYF